MSRLQCLKVLPLRCIRKNLNKLFEFKQVFINYKSSGRILSVLWFDCYKSRPGVQTGSISVFRCLFDYVPWTLLSYKEATNLIKKGSFNCSAIATNCPNSQSRCPLRTRWQHALPFFSDKWLQWTISPSPPRKSFNLYKCMKYTLCVPHLYVKQ